MSPSPKGLSILYLSVGSGHQIAAESLANAIQREEPDLPVMVEDPFADKNKILPKVLNALQTVSIVLAPDIYDLAWRRKTDYDSYQWLSDMGLLQDFLLERLSKYNVATVTATHVLPCILAGGLKRRSLINNVYGVITDFGAHSLWPTRDIDRYFVASEELKNTLSFREINSPDIQVTGIPIKPIYQSKFLKPTSPTIKVLVITGGMRSGSYAGLHSYFSDLLSRIEEENLENVELTIVTGNQKQLKKDLTRQQKNSRLNIRILGYVQDMPRLMMSNDIIITKPGGLIISETLAIGMCIILARPGPGQESANADFLARNGAAFKGDTPEDVVKVLNYLCENRNVIDEMKIRSKNLGYPNSADAIAKIILNDLKHET